jgi:hypothetical protein
VIIGGLLVLLIFASVFGFIVWRLWWSLKNQRFELRGWTYRRSEKPAYFWVEVAMHVIGALMIGAIGLFMAAALLGGSLA